jgi:hypothetical protein
MRPLGMPWAFLGLFTGVWKLLIVSGVAATVLWRSGLWQHPLLRLLLPWSSTGRPASTKPVAPASRSISNDRFFWFLTIVASVGVAAWVVTRLMITTSAHPPIAR